MKSPLHEWTALGVAAVCLLFGTKGKADIKNFTFQGTINTVVDPEFLLDGSVTNGAPFEGFYIFQTSAQDSNSDPTVADYRYSESAFGVVVKVGSYVFRTNPRHVEFLIELVNRPDGDNYLLHSYHNICSQPLFVDHISWQLDDPTGSTLTNTDLSVTPPNLSDYQSWFGMGIGGGVGGMPYLIRGTVNSIAEAPPVIPERPATILGDAVEVSWPSRLGYFYQIQSSVDLTNWTNIDEPVLGDGAVLSKFFPRQATQQLFYRAEIANFSD